MLDVDHRDPEASLAIDPLMGWGVTVARYTEVQGEPGVVEFAATVAGDRQGIGLGSARLAGVMQRGDEGHSASPRERPGRRVLSLRGYDLASVGTCHA